MNTKIVLQPAEGARLSPLVPIRNDHHVTQNPQRQRVNSRDLAQGCHRGYSARLAHQLAGVAAFNTLLPKLFRYMTSFSTTIPAKTPTLIILLKEY